VDPTKIQFTCVRCQAVLNVPHGLANFRCPQCGVDLAVDVSKPHNFLTATTNGAPPASGATPPSSIPAPVLPTAEVPEEINEVMFAAFSVYTDSCIIIHSSSSEAAK
jgi:hypothetical protein